MMNLNVPDTLLSADRIMRLYGAWSHDRFKKNHCASFEWHYDSSEDPENDNPDKKDGYAPPATLHDFEVMDIHRAVIRVPDKHRKFLFAVYVPQRLPFIAQARRLGINALDHQLFLEKGLTMFWNCYIKKGIRTVRST